MQQNLGIQHTCQERQRSTLYNSLSHCSQCRSNVQTMEQSQRQTMNNSEWETRVTHLHSICKQILSEKEETLCKAHLLLVLSVFTGRGYTGLSLYTQERKTEGLRVSNSSCCPLTTAILAPLKKTREWDWRFLLRISCCPDIITLLTVAHV